MSNVKFSQLPDLPQGSITANTIVPVVEGGVNYTVTTANLQSYVNSTTGNITGGNVISTGIVSATGNVRGANLNTGGVVSATGNVSGSNINTSGVVSATGNVTGGNVISTGIVSATGNVTGSFFLGNGSQLSGLPAAYTNSNVATFLSAFGSNTISSTGNITTTANIAGGYILGNGSQLTGLPASYGNANVTALLASFGSNTISSTGNITTTANVSGNYILGNGSQLTGLPATYGNSNVTTLLAGFGSNTISTTGNVTAGYFVGNGSALTGIVTSAGSLISNGGTYANAVTANGLLRLAAANTISGFDGATITLQDSGNGGNISISAISGGGWIFLSGSTQFQGLVSTTGAIVMSGGQITSSTLVADTVRTSTLFKVPTYTIAAKPATGEAGLIISITNSPTQAGKMAYWSTTSSSWRYIADDTAV